LKYRLDDGRVVRRSALYGSPEMPRIVEKIPGWHDRISEGLLPIVGLLMAAAAIGAVAVGVWVGLGWWGAANGAWATLVVAIGLCFTGATVNGTIVDDRDEWRPLVGWAILAVVAVAWAASDHPSRFETAWW
jgi:hypothetical protein